MAVTRASVRPPLAWVELSYPESDGQPMAETGIHVDQMMDLVKTLREFFRDRADVYVGANMFLYYREGDPRKVVAPDVFVCFGVSKEERRTWKVWSEGKAPDVIFELTSQATWDEDLGTKKGLYEVLGVMEYFLFDPLEEYLRPVLQGFRLTETGYIPIALEQSSEGAPRLSSEMLGLSIEVEKGRLRLRDRATGRQLLTPAEAYEELARLRAELAQLRDEARSRGE